MALWSEVSSCLRGKFLAECDGDLRGERLDAGVVEEGNAVALMRLDI